MPLSALVDDALGGVEMLVEDTTHDAAMPSFVVSTEVVFALPDERLVIRQDAGPTPAPYVAGTLLGVQVRED